MQAKGVRTQRGGWHPIDSLDARAWFQFTRIETRCLGTPRPWLIHRASLLLRDIYKTPRKRRELSPRSRSFVTDYKSSGRLSLSLFLVSRRGCPPSLHRKERRTAVFVFVVAVVVGVVHRGEQRRRAWMRKTKYQMLPSQIVFQADAELTLSVCRERP